VWCRDYRVKILLVSQDGIGAWFMLRLLREGHNVDYYLLKEKCYDILYDIVPKPLREKPDFARYDLVIFDLSGRPKLAEEARSKSPTIGDSDLATELEENRLFGIEVMEQAGIEVPPYEVFDDLNSAKRFIRKENKRFVFKPNGDQLTSLTYVSSSAEDMLKYIDHLETDAKGVEFLLQEVVEGTEVSTEAYFNGSEFFLINGTLEEKKFMEGRKGPNTGCAGNLVWNYAKEPRIFKRGLELMQPFLQESGYVGMIDLNTIASSSHLYGLEWTPRFGYDATSTLFCTISSDLGEFLFGISNGDTPTVEIKAEFAASVRLSIPPYPSECEGFYHEGIPINGIEPEDMDEIYLYDAKIMDDELVTAGRLGFVAAPIGCGRSIEEAWAVVKEKVKRIKIPDMQFRQDLYKCTKERYDVLSAQGWLKG
jgi:phosphoribosylamine-glycine ligase